MSGVLSLLDGRPVIDLGWGGSHSKRSPSAADRWMTCPGSVALSAHFESESSIYASEGTVAHHVREQCLRHGLDVADFVGKIFHTEGYYWEVLPEWERFLQPTIDWARSLKAEVYVEHRVSLAPWAPDDGGTLDLGLVTDDMIYVNDLKFGQGVLVEAEGNRQQMLYALGFWQHVARHKTKATAFRLMIDQPRARDGSGSWWDITLDELLAFGEEVKTAVAATEDPDAELTPSAKACMWCEVGRNLACPAQHGLAFEIAGWNGLVLTPDDRLPRMVELMPELETLSPERKAFILRNWPVVSKWFSTLKSSAVQDALSGNAPPGFKAVATEGDRVWSSESEVAEFLSEKAPRIDGFNKQLKSPAQLEKILPTKVWEEAQCLVFRPEGLPALVPESDKRPAIMNCIDLLDDLDDSEDMDDIADPFDGLL